MAYLVTSEDATYFELRKTWRTQSTLEKIQEVEVNVLSVSKWISWSPSLLFSEDTLPCEALTVFEFKKSTNHPCNNSFYEFFCYSQRAHCGLQGGRCSWRQPDAGWVAAMSAAFRLSDSSPGSTETAEQGLSPVLCSLNHHLSPLHLPLASLLPSAFALSSHTIIYLFILFLVLLFGKHSESAGFARRRSRMAQMAWCWSQIKRKTGMKKPAFRSTDENIVISPIISATITVPIYQLFLFTPVELLLEGQLNLLKQTMQKWVDCPALVIAAKR